MLTAESEGGQLKCHPYWAAKEYGAFRLKALSEKKLFLDRRRHRESASRKDSGRRRANTNVLSSPATSYNEQPFVVIRKLALSHVSEPFSPLREITQLHCSSWPDFGTPAQPSHLLSLVELSNTLQSAALGIDGRENTENARPLLVHCSAGCGRTGTFCTVDSVIDMLKRRRQEQSAGVMPMGVSQGSDSDLVCAGGEGEKDTSDNWIFNDQEDLIQKTVEDFRRQRISMVQGLRQYVLCYESVLEWVSQQQRFGKRERSGSESRAN
jgi:tyrosine-protein phosphatase 2/3